MVVLYAMALVVAGFAVSGGVFSYSLDDAYIHLAMSEGIARGGYGINRGEAAAAASSILYPFLLAPFAGTWAHEFAPLALNCIGLALAVTALGAMFRTVGVFDPRRETAWIVGAALAFNLPGLALTGMEHTLHVAATLAIALGLIRVAHGGAVAGWLIAAILAAPLLRYEGLAPALAACVLLALQGRWRLSAALALAVLAAMAAFSAFLVAHGLPFLPSSVLSKAHLAGAAAHGRVDPELPAVIANLATAPGALLAAMCVFCLTRLRAGDPATRVSAAFGASVAGAHALVGGFDWYPRYEIYALVGGACATAYAWRAPLRAGVARLDPSVRPVVLVLAVLIAGAASFHASLSAPWGMANISAQQREMRRLVVDHWREPVAVNDLGWVSFRNDAHVLDLRGLGSEDARRARTRGDGDGWIGPMVAERGVGLALVYVDPDWIAAPPPEWIRRGELRLAMARVTVAEPVVTIYATGPQHIDAVDRALSSFSASLSSNARLTATNVASRGPDPDPAPH